MERKTGALNLNAKWENERMREANFDNWQRDLRWCATPHQPSTRQKSNFGKKPKKNTRLWRQRQRQRSNGNSKQILCVYSLHNLENCNKHLRTSNTRSTGTMHESVSRWIPNYVKWAGPNQEDQRDANIYLFSSSSSSSLLSSSSSSSSRGWVVAVVDL